VIARLHRRPQVCDQPAGDLRCQGTPPTKGLRLEAREADPGTVFKAFGHDTRDLLARPDGFDVDLQCHRGRGEYLAERGGVPAVSRRYAA
jgi:hypothetical protein